MSVSGPTAVPLRVRADPRTVPESYIPLVAGFWVLMAALPMLAKRVRHAPPPPTNANAFVQLSLATYFVARVVSRERAGSFLREPFVEPRPGAPAHPVVPEQEQIRGTGLRAATGELLTCSRCLGLWAAAGLYYLRALAPTEGRVVVPVLGAAGANAFLQAGFALLAKRANHH